MKNYMKGVLEIQCLVIEIYIIKKKIVYLRSVCLYTGRLMARTAWNYKATFSDRMGACTCIEKALETFKYKWNHNALCAKAMYHICKKTTRFCFFYGLENSKLNMFAPAGDFALLDAF